VTPLATAVVLALRSLASSLRDRTAPPGVPGLRDRHLALAAAMRGPAADDTDMMVDAIDTIATLPAPRATDRARPRHDDVEWPPSDSLHADSSVDRTPRRERRDL
jgi:hypothetical protein